MASGPGKRQTVRRHRSSSGLELSFSADEGTSPISCDEGSSRLSLATKERSADQTFQTEEWVRNSDFDVCTATAAIEGLKSDYDAVIGDTLADWETISRDSDKSLVSFQDPRQKIPNVDEVRSLSSLDDEDDDERKSISSADTNSSDVFLEKPEDDDSSSSIVVVLSPREQEDGGYESSYAKVVSLETRTDDDHESNFSEVASLKSQTDDNHGSLVDVSFPDQEDEDDTIGILETISQGEQVDELELVQKDEDDKKSSNFMVDVTSSAFDIVTEDQSRVIDVATVLSWLDEPKGVHLPDWEDSEIKALELGELETPESSIDFSSEEKMKELKSVKEEPESKVEDSCQPKDLHYDIQSINCDNEEQTSRTLEVSPAPGGRVCASAIFDPKKIHWESERIAKEAQDAPVCIDCPGLEQHKSNQLVEIARAEEIIYPTVVEVSATTGELNPIEEGQIQDLHSVMVEENASAEDDQCSHGSILQNEAESSGQPLEHSDEGSGRVLVEFRMHANEDDQSEGISSAFEESLKEDSDVQWTEEEDQTLATKESTFAHKRLQREGGLPMEVQKTTPEVLREESQKQSTLPADYSQKLETTDFPIKSQIETLMQLGNSSGSEISKSDVEQIKDVEADVEASSSTINSLSTEEPKDPLNVYHVTLQRAEEHRRPREVAEDIFKLSCCLPIVWLIDRLLVILGEQLWRLSRPL